MSRLKAIGAAMSALLLASAVVCAVPGSARAAGLAELRAERSGAGARLDAARAERIALEKSLEEFAARIEALKAGRGGANRGAGLFADGELDGLLKRSQAISNQLALALRAERDAEQAAAASQSRLLAGLDAALDALYGGWEKAGAHGERQALVPQIRALRTERAALRPAVPAQASVPQFESTNSEDGEELLERADALLDASDKLHREEQAITERIQELQRERAVQRRMDEFLSESALFDEHDRRLVVSRQATTVAPSGAQPGAQQPVATTPPNSGPGNQPSTSDGTSKAANDSFGAGNGDGVGAVVPHDSPSPGHQTGLEPMPSSSGASAFVTSRTPPERGSAGNGVAARSDDESLEELTARRARIHDLAAELQRRAADAAQRARELR